MKGLCIINGINYAGKGYVKDLITSATRNIYPENPWTILPSASQMMRKIGNLPSYDALGAMDEASRDILRAQMLLWIREEAKVNPVIFDTHFSFEDGECPDLSILLPVTRHIITVVADPEIIHARAAADENRVSHPGRRKLFDEGTGFISLYQERELMSARCFVEEGLSQGLPIPWTRTYNNGNRQPDELLHDLIPPLICSMEGGTSPVEHLRPTPSAFRK